MIKDVIIHETRKTGEGESVQDLVVIGKRIEGVLPALFAPDAKTAKRVLEFFAAQIRNGNTRKAYARAAGEFAAWCNDHGINELGTVRPVHVAAYIEGLGQKNCRPFG